MNPFVAARALSALALPVALALGRRRRRAERELGPTESPESPEPPPARATLPRLRSRQLRALAAATFVPTICVGPTWPACMLPALS